MSFSEKNQLICHLTWVCKVIKFTAWQIQTIGFTCLTLSNFKQPYFEEFKIIPTWVTTVLGLILVIFGLGSKCAAIYGTGYNTYYWYDMVLDVPNAYFIENGNMGCEISWKG